MFYCKKRDFLLFYLRTFDVFELVPEVPLGQPNFLQFNLHTECLVFFSPVN